MFPLSAVNGAFFQLNAVNAANAAFLRFNVVNAAIFSIKRH